ncbi:MAG: hypothetical protein CL489_10265 [Acidobacteria bacterium]|nr:hypothetical protein [Acidobacteriota bacterium]|tara:strand:+ start:7280 stop:7720 length:441 start_codon:yes stop_codon:yes gene_type:complete
MEYVSSIEKSPRNKHLSIARNLLEKHPDPEHRYRLIAVGFKGSRVIDFGFNSAKTHPEMLNLAEKFNIEKMYPDSTINFVSQAKHAEISCLTNCDECDTLLVLRLTRDGALANAKPCNICFAKILESGVKRVYYSTKNGFEMMRLN